MSSTTTTSSKASAPAIFSKPIDILPGQFSSVYANVHPVLLLSILLVSFRSLVKDPVSSLIGLTPTVAIIQILYCVLCLPSTGQAPPAKNPKPGEKKKSPKTGQDFGSKIVPAFLSLVLTVTLSTPILYILAVLFGAPLVTHLPHTALFALHVALLASPQLFYVHGLDAKKWLEILSLQLPVDEVYGMSLGSFVGAWLGAIPIPLDWDREWQKWPVTVTTGLYVGAVVGKLVGGHLLKSKKIKFT